MKRRSMVIAGAAVVMAAGTGGGVAYATTGGTHAVSGTASTSAAASSQPDQAKKGQAKADQGKKHHRTLAQRSLHGDFTVRAHGDYVTIAVQRGEVTATADGHVTVKSRDGYTHTYTVDSDTRVRVNADKSSASALHTGDQVRVMSSPKKGQDTAAAVLAHHK